MPKPPPGSLISSHFFIILDTAEFLDLRIEQQLKTADVNKTDTDFPKQQLCIPLPSSCQHGNDVLDASVDAATPKSFASVDSSDSGILN